MVKVQKFENCTQIAVYFGVVTDLWRENEGGWSANGAWRREVTVIVPWGASYATVARKVKAALNIQGMRRDSWTGDRLCWRDGCIGAYAFEQGSN
jgi:hypothetical protein